MRHTLVADSLIRAITVPVLFSLAACATPTSQFEGLTFDAAIMQDFVVGHEAERPGERITEFVPKGETVENWTQMITILTYDIRKRSVSIEFQGLKEQYEKDCGKIGFSEPVIRNENGYQTTLFRLACDKSAKDGTGEYTYFKILEGQSNLFVVQRAWRGNLPDPETRPISASEHEDWMAFFGSVSIMSR